MSDKVTAWLRTVVPAAWGSFILWLVTQIPAIPDSVENWLNSDSVKIGVATAVIGLWYWVWRKYESKVPAWLITIVMGSPKTPSYSESTVTVSPEGIAHVVTPTTEQHFDLGTNG